MDFHNRQFELSTSAEYFKAFSTTFPIFLAEITEHIRQVKERGNSGIRLLMLYSI